MKLSGIAAQLMFSPVSVGKNAVRHSSLFFAAPVLEL